MSVNLTDDVQLKYNLLTIKKKKKKNATAS